MARPSEGRPTPHGSNPFDMFGAFVPWIVYWILVGNVSFRLAVTIAFVLTIAIPAYSVIRGPSLNVLEIGGNLVFLALEHIGQGAFA